MSRNAGFMPFSFASFSQINHTNVKELGLGKNKQRTVREGLNLQGICKNKQCVAYEKKVYSPLGYGQFHLTYYVKNTPCFLCGKKLKHVQSGCIRKSIVIGRGSKAKEGDQTDISDDDEEEEEVIFEHMISEDKSRLRFSNLHKEIVLWHYLILKTIEPKTTYCPGYHGYLSQYLLVEFEWTCAKCEKTFPPSQRAKSCKTCDYYLCYQCF